MARYRGPRIKRCRAVGMVLPGLTTEVTLSRPTPPGVHGAKRKGKPTEFKVRMEQKQRVRFHYGILEKQFIRYVREASRRRGATGRELITLLESRLDNVVWRLGLAATIAAARQLVVHGHILVNNKRVDRPSFHVPVGAEIGVKERSRSKAVIQEAVERAATRQRPRFLEFDPAKVVGKLITAPEAEDVPMEVNLQAIVEFYSQRA